MRGDGKRGLGPWGLLCLWMMTRPLRKATWSLLQHCIPLSIACAKESDLDRIAGEGLSQCGGA